MRGLVFQCLQCGELHEIDIEYKLEDELYIELMCPKCRDTTRHLFCGDKDTMYTYYNLNTDSRYYKYNTK